MNLGGAVKEKVARYDTMLENITLRRTELKQKYLSEKSDEQKYTEEYRVLEGQAATVSDNLVENQKKLDRLEADLRSKTDRSGTVRSDMNRYSQELIRLKSRHESLRNLTERYEGYGGSIRRVMEQKDRVPGILGVVADLIQTSR